MASHGLHAVIHGSYQMARWPLSLTMACKGARGPFHSQWPSEGQMAALTHDGLQRARGALWALSLVAFSAKRANGLRGAGRTRPPRGPLDPPVGGPRLPPRSAPVSHQGDPSSEKKENINKKFDKKIHAL